MIILNQVNLDIFSEKLFRLSFKEIFDVILSEVAKEVLMRQKVLCALADKQQPPFEPVFLTETERQIEKQKEVEVKNEKKSIFKNLPQLDDEEIVEFVSRDLTGKLLESRIFRIGIVAVIITNSLMIAIETNKNLAS